jgi:hypothetical protein
VLAIRFSLTYFKRGRKSGEIHGIISNSQHWYSYTEFEVPRVPSKYHASRFLLEIDI